MCDGADGEHCEVNVGQLFANKPTYNADIGKWNVASVSNTQELLISATAFNGNIDSWNVASVTTMRQSVCYHDRRRSHRSSLQLHLVEDAALALLALGIFAKGGCGRGREEEGWCAGQSGGSTYSSCGLELGYHVL